MTRPIIQIPTPPLGQPITTEGVSTPWYMWFNALYNFVLGGSSTVCDGDFTMIANATYIVNSTSPVNLTLPNKFNPSDQITILGLGSGGWKVLQNAGQVIHFGATSTTIGTGGSIASGNRYNTLTLRGLVQNTELSVQAHEGTLNVV